jgi:hypothetical protein
MIVDSKTVIETINRRRSPYKEICRACGGSGNSNKRSWDHTTGRVWAKCVNCRGYGLTLNYDFFDRAVTWDLWLCDKPNPITRFLSWLIRPLCRVAVSRWDDVG